MEDLEPTRFSIVCSFIPHYINFATSGARAPAVGRDRIARRPEPIVFARAAVERRQTRAPVDPRRGTGVRGARRFEHGLPALGPRRGRGDHRLLQGQDDRVDAGSGAGVRGGPAGFPAGAAGPPPPPVGRAARPHPAPPPPPLPPPPPSPASLPPARGWRSP